MFTGLIRHLGAVRSNEPAIGGARLILGCEELARTTGPGASIAVNGVCLSVAENNGLTLAFDVVPETLGRSNLGRLKGGEAVNLEPSLRLGDPLDGQLVYGHVDAASAMLRKEREGRGYRIWCSMPPQLSGLICEKGYVALDGVSLTVAEIASDGSFAVALVPETIKRTTLGRKEPGAMLNVEADPVARYVAAILAVTRPKM